MTTSPATPTRTVHLPGLQAFDSVARHMNFARAANEHAVTPTAMSKTVKLLEAQLGIRLFNRTTRSVALTEAGAKPPATPAPALAPSAQSIGHAVQRDMIALPIGPLQRLVVVASPRYLARHGMPKAPRDLLTHDCVRQRIGDRGRFLDWDFVSGAKPLRIDVQGRLIVNEMRC